MAYYPEYQKKLHDEIQNELGDRMPLHEDMAKMHYTMAFISEMLRFRNPAPIGVFHKTLTNCKLGKFYK